MAPTLALETVGITSPTSKSVITVKAVFAEPVVGFTLKKVSMSGGGRFANFLAISASEYTFEVLPLSSQASLVLWVEGGVVSDLAGNVNTASAMLNIVHDSSPVTVISLTTSASSPSFIDPVPVTVEFNKQINPPLKASTVAVSGGIIGNFLVVSKKRYTFEVIPNSSSVAVEIRIPEGITKDAAGNANLASNALIISHDSEMPSIKSLTSSMKGPTASAPIPMTVEFSEPVRHFAVSDVTVLGGVVDKFTSINSTTFKFNINPVSSTVDIDVTIYAGVCEDLAGNLNTAAPEHFTIRYDSDPPSIRSFGSMYGAMTSATLIPLMVVFTEPVSLLSNSDLSISGGFVTNIERISHSQYLFTVSPNSNFVQIVASVPAGVVTDGSNLPNLKSPVLIITHDSVQPKIQSLTAPILSSGVTSHSPIPVTVVFTEPVREFIVTDVLVVGGVTANFTGSGAKYTFDVYPSAAKGILSIKIPAGVAKDAADNVNEASAELPIKFDKERPTVTLTVPKPFSSKKLQNPIPVTVTFSESVRGFDDQLKDIQVFNGIAANIEQLDATGMKYRFLVAPYPSLSQSVSSSSTELTITIFVVAGAAVDYAGNPNLAPQPLVVIHDSVEPKVVSLTSNPGNQSPIPVTVVFSEPVTGFDDNSVVVTGGVALPIANIPGAKDTFVFEVVPSRDSVVLRIQISAQSVQDGVGNLNSELATLLVNYDFVAPQVELKSDMASHVSLSPMPVTVLFSEPVVGFKLEHISFQGGVGSNFKAISAGQYMLDVYPVPNSLGVADISVRVPGQAAFDVAKNPNVPSNELLFHFDCKFFVFFFFFFCCCNLSLLHNFYFYLHLQLGGQKTQLYL